MRGTVTLMKSESAWKGFFGMSDMLCGVVIQGGEIYQLRIRMRWYRRDIDYELRDSRGSVIDQRQLVWSREDMRMDLSLPGYPLEYVITYGNMRASDNKRLFISPDEEKKAFFNTSGNTRSLEVAGINCKHHDYQSEVHFRCPDERIIQGVMVANLLFNQPQVEIES